MMQSLPKLLLEEMQGCRHCNYTGIVSYYSYTASTTELLNEDDMKRLEIPITHSPCPVCRPFPQYQFRRWS